MADVTVRTLRIKLEADGSMVVTGVESAKRSLDDLHNTSGSVSARMSRQWATFKQNWLGVTAAITAAIVALRQAWDMAEQAAKFEEQREAVSQLAKQWSVAGDDIILSIQKQARGLISLADAANIASTALARGFSPREILQLTEMAERFSDVMGTDVAGGVEKLSEAVSGMQTKTLKQLGIVFDADAAYKEYAASIGKSVEQLEIADKQQAFLNATLAAGAKVIDQLGPAMDSTADRMDRLKAQWSDLQTKIGGILIRVGSGLMALGDLIVVQWNWWLGIIFKGLNKLDQFLAWLGITSGQNFVDNIEAAESGMQAALESMKQNWADVWNKNEIAASDAMDKVVEKVRKATDDIKQVVATIPTPAPDDEVVDDAYATMEARQRQHAKLERILYNGQTEAEFRHWEERVQIVSGAMGSFANLFQTLSNIQGEHQKAAFALFKAFAVAQAVIDTHAAYMRALATYPPPFSYIAAAAAVASGLARVAAIMSTQPQGATGVVSAAGPGAGTISQGPPAQQTPTGPTIINVHFAGTVFGGNRDAIARELVRSIRKAEADYA